MNLAGTMSSAERAAIGPPLDSAGPAHASHTHILAVHAEGVRVFPVNGCKRANERAALFSDEGELCGSCFDGRGNATPRAE